MGRNQQEAEDYVIVETPHDIHGYLSDDTPCSSFDLCDDVSYSIQLDMSICSDASDISLQKFDQQTENSSCGEDLDESADEPKLINMPDSDHISSSVEEKLDTTRSIVCKDSTISVLNSNGREKKNESADHTEPRKTLSMSRASNKKRRKKLKMMKKAQAASNAAKCLAEQDHSMKKGKKSKNRVKNCSSSKKVENIAVACATKSLATYRQEHGIMNQQRL